MLETRAFVVQADERYAQVQADQENGCGSCNGCSKGKQSGLFRSRPRLFKVDNLINARVGDQVVVSVAGGAVLRGIGLVYLLPLVLLFAGAMLAGGWAVQDGQRDGYAAVGALSGLAAGFVFARWVLQREANRRNRPYIARLWRG